MPNFDGAYDVSLRLRGSWSFYFFIGTYGGLLFTMFFDNPCMFVKTMPNSHATLGPVPRATHNFIHLNPPQVANNLATLGEG